MMDGEEMLGLAEGIVSRALRGRASEAEVYLAAAADVEVDVEGGRLAGLSRSHHRGGSVRVVQDGHLGFAYFADPDQAKDAIDAALRMARHAPRTGYRLSGGGPPLRLLRYPFRPYRGKSAFQQGGDPLLQLLRLE